MRPVRKQLGAQVEEAGERRLKFLLSTKDRDRDGDTIDPQGWILTNYLKNPVVLFAHKYDTPAVAKTISIEIAPEGLVAVAEFPSAEVYEFGHTLYLLYREGFMRAVSVGFNPVEWREREDGVDYIKQELLEWSLVPVPANPDALVQAQVKGIKTFLIENFGKEEEKMEVAKGVIPYKRTPLAPMDTPWDAGAEVREASVEDLKIMCAWYDEENPDVKYSYKLPHHKARGQHACVWRGVVAAMAALFGARGGVDIPEADRKGVYDHLAKHYQDFGKEPPEFKEYTEEELREVFKEAFEDETEIVEKAGRVLSKANEERIRKAVELLQEVLRQLEADNLENEESEQEVGKQEEKEEIGEDELRDIVRAIIEKEISKIKGRLD